MSGWVTVFNLKDSFVISIFASIKAIRVEVKTSEGQSRCMKIVELIGAQHLLVSKGSLRAQNSFTTKSTSVLSTIQL